jgi:GT2 family glycosyltransferase
MTSDSLPPLSVVIPTWNAARFIERVLQALWALDYPHFELIVVDNGVVNQETKVVVDKWEPLFQQRSCKLKIYQYSELLGYAGAVNEGVRLAEYDLVAITNNDNLPNRHWLKDMIAVWNQKTWEQKTIALVSANVSRPGIKSGILGATNIFGRVIFFPEKKMSDTAFPVMHPDGSSFLMNRAVLGLPYESEYFMYHEDVYIGWRAWNMGFACLMAPKARVESFDGGTTRRLAYQTAFYSERNRILNCLLFLEKSTLLKIFPLLIADMGLAFIFGRQKVARVRAWVWLLTQVRWWWPRRMVLQAARQADDAKVLKVISVQYFTEQANFKTIKFSVNALLKVYAKAVRLNLAMSVPRDQ